MFSKVLLAAALLAAPSAGENYTSLASFSSNGIMGYVAVQDGYVHVSLNITELAMNNFSGIPGNSTCFDDGLKYHIHTDWKYMYNTDMVGDACGGSYTGGHWDPWLGCGAATGNEYCTAKGDYYSCVDGSSVLDEGAYSCSEDNFAGNPYSCEVGDWSGKYGKVWFSGYYGEATGYSPFEVSPSDFVGGNYSVVFHCGGSGARAFCAPFENSTIAGTERPTQAWNGVEDTMVAYFDEMGDEQGLLMTPNNNLWASMDIGALDLPSDCGNSLHMRIYNSWDDDLGYSDIGANDVGKNNSCAAAVGEFYDPTVSCAPGSDSEFCTDEALLCMDPEYNYTCDWQADRFGCAPGDLSGKFGMCDTSESWCNLSVSDPLMMDLSLLQGKSVVLQCSATWEIVACAGFYIFDAGNDTRFTANCSDADSCNAAAAGFERKGIEGQVAVLDGRLFAELSIWELNNTYNFSGIPGGESCFEEGLKFHVHERWDYDTDLDARIGSDACGGGVTGGHWDPWLGCGGATGNEYCAAKDEEYSCVTGSSVLGGSAYNCSTTTFAKNPYACEVGDWNGKYGKAYVTGNGTIAFYGMSPYEADANDIIGKSIVFHCGGSGSRAFCAPFEGYELPWTLSRPTQSNDSMVYANLDAANNSWAAFLGNGSFAVYIATEELDVPSDCGDITVRIFNDWDSSYSSMTSGCSSVVGSFYDPTVSCAPDSDSEFCINDVVCNDTSYEYDCAFSEDGTRFLCAPGDISGKFGTCAADGSACWISDVDPLMLDTSLMPGRSLVAQCSNTSEILLCGGLKESNGSMDGTTTMMPMSTMSTMMSTMSTRMSTMMSTMSTDGGGGGGNAAQHVAAVQFGTVLVGIVTIVSALF